MELEAVVARGVVVLAEQRDTPLPVFPLAL